MQVYPVFLPFGGCSERCSFCAQTELTGQGFRPPLAELERTLDRMLPAEGHGEVAFYGGTFTLLPPAAQRDYLQLAARFAAAGRISGSRVSTRPDALPPEAIARLADQGCRTVELGCQSFSPAVLRAAGRSYGAAQVADAVAGLRARSLQVGLQLMPGLPGGDRQEALDSLWAALELQPDFLRIYPTLVFAGTRLAEDWSRGSFQPWTLEQAVDCCAELLWHCQRAKVPVIRLGLQGQARFEQGDGPLAGPYHPAFGQLVRSKLWRRGLETALDLEPGSHWQVHPFDFPDALGHRKDNLAHFRTLRQGFSLSGDPELGRDRLRCGGEIFSLQQLVTFSKRNLTT